MTVVGVHWVPAEFNVYEVLGHPSHVYGFVDVISVSSAGPAVGVLVVEGHEAQFHGFDWVSRTSALFPAPFVTPLHV